jgi:hypothetical protein
MQPRHTSASVAVCVSILWSRSPLGDARRSSTSSTHRPGSDPPHSTAMAPMRLPNALVGTFRATSLRPAAAWRQRCSYHSHEFTQPPPFPPAETSILSAAISHVPHYGFTADALKLGARDAGYLDVSTNLLPRGVFDLINYHLVTQRLALKDTVQFPSEGDHGKTLGLGVKVRTLALARLRANEPIIHRWQEVSLRYKDTSTAGQAYIPLGTRYHGPTLIHRPVRRRTCSTGRRNLVPFRRQKCGWELVHKAGKSVGNLLGYGSLHVPRYVEELC